MSKAAYFAKGKEVDLIELAEELGLTVSDDLRSTDLRNIVIEDKDYDEEFTKELFNRIINERVKKEEDKRRQEEEFELNKRRQGENLSLKNKIMS